MRRFRTRVVIVGLLSVLAGPMLPTGTAHAQSPAAPAGALSATETQRRALPWAGPTLGGVLSAPAQAAAGEMTGQTPAAPPPPVRPDAKGSGPVLLAAKARRPVRARGAARAVPAKTLFGAASAPAALAARAIGYYSRGCLAGARQIAVDGPSWQAMRLSRNRRWGHPIMIALVERLAKESREMDAWPGLLVGDISQPRGGPMLTGHASHQIGLDSDVWLTPMPGRRLTVKEREELVATSMLAADKISVDPKVWTDKHAALIKRAATYPEVERILVHPAIKKALCATKDTDRAWLGRVRPYWGHHYHFHIRIGCPPGSTNCRRQAAAPKDDGCGKELNDWMVLLTAPPKPAPKVPPKPRPEITLDTLPKECRAVLEAEAPK